MKKIFFFILLLIGISFSAFAQEEGAAKKERMFREVQEFKMKYLAQEMELSEVQKKKFFELYEELSQKRRECYAPAIVLEKEVKHNPKATEEDYEKATEAMNKANAEFAVIDKEYNEKFSEFLSQKQIFKMKEAENNFKVKLSEMRHNRKKDHRKGHEDK